MFHRRSAGALRDYNTRQGLQADAPVPAEVRAQIRSGIPARMFAETYGRDPVDARELSGLHRHRPQRVTCFPLNGGQHSITQFNPDPPRCC